MKDSDLYWLAGLLEGEGCFSICGGNGNTPTVAVGMTDIDIMERVGRLLGKTPYRPAQMFSSGKRVRDSHRIHIYGKPAVAWMRRLYPLMGHRRQARIREVLEITGHEPISE